jgi:hypothetical protein
MRVLVPPIAIRPPYRTKFLRFFGEATAAGESSRCIRVKVFKSNGLH